jgi:peptide/nickel transport system substrate-binding protein
VKRLIIRHMKDPSTQLLPLQRGDIDITRNLGADQLKSLAGNRTSVSYRHRRARRCISP